MNVLLLGGAALLILVIAAVVRVSRRSRGAKEELAWASTPTAATPAPATVNGTDVELDALIEAGGNEGVTIEGTLRVKGQMRLPTGLILRGGLQVDDGAELDAIVEVFGNATLGKGARLLRPLVVHGDMTLAKDARAPSCHVDGAVVLGPGACIDGALHCDALYLEESDEVPLASVATEPLVIEKQTT